MDIKKVEKWLQNNNLFLEKSFAITLKELIEEYKNKKQIKTLNKVYKLINLKKEYIYYWEKHHLSNQQKKIIN